MTVSSPSQLTSKGLEFISDKDDCDSLLAELELRLSTDYFEKLQSQVYDVGTVMEELQDTMEDLKPKLSFPLPSCDKVSQVPSCLDGNRKAIAVVCFN